MRGMNWMLAAALVVASVPFASATVQADEKDEEHEKPVKLEDVPKPARETILREAAGAPIVKVERETFKGKPAYEAHVKKGDAMIGIVVDPTGKLLERHSEEHEDE